VPPILPQSRSIKASQCISELPRLRLPSSHDHGLPNECPNPHDNGLGVYCQTRSITASEFGPSRPSKCISKLARSRPWSASPYTLDHSLQVYLQTSSIPASMCTQSRPSKCISTLTQSRPRSASPNSLHYVLQVCNITAIEMHLLTCSMTASECISNLARSQSLSVSRNSHNYSLQVHFPIRPSTACKCISILAWLRPPSSNNHGRQVHVSTCQTTASECISMFTRSWCGEALELECRQPIINTPLHLPWHPKGIGKQERLWLEECRQMVRACQVFPAIMNHTNSVG
jgi:hypothetical protein